MPPISKSRQIQSSGCKSDPAKPAAPSEENTDETPIAPVPMITTRLEMVRFLAEQLNRYEPHVAMKSDMVDYLTSYFHESKKVIMFDAPPFESGYLFDLISWGDDAAAHHCGLPLLKFLSQMNDMVARAGGVMDFKISWLIRIMMHYLDDADAALFECRYRKGRLRIKTTPAGLTRFGVRLDVRLGSTRGDSEDYEDWIRPC